MEVGYDKSELENDKTYQFIRDLDLPAEPNIIDVEEESPYKFSSAYNKNTKRRRDRNWKTNKAALSRHSINTVHLASNHCDSIEYCDIASDENLAISQYSEGSTKVKNYSDSCEILLTSQQHERSSVSNEARTSSQYNQFNNIYSSDNTGELISASQSNLGDVRTCQSVNTGINHAISQYRHCDPQTYETFTNNPVNTSETTKQNQVVSAVWDVIDPHGKVRGIHVSVPETPIFSTGIVTPNKVQSSVSAKIDSYQKRIIRYSKFVLYSPRECDITKPEVDRPDGCKTIVITGIPEKMKEEMVKDVFRKCGRITKIRMRKSRCYITFASISSVDNALKFIGYQVVVRDRREGPYCGKIHIDFVPVQEEQLQYERAKQKERDAMKDHGPIGPLLPHFSEATATTVVDQLQNEDSLEVGVKSLIKWMEEGKCNRNNADSFFSFLQTMQGFVSRMMKDTAKVEEEVRQHQCKLNGKYAANSLHFVTILKAFDIATSQKIWDHFSKTQRSRIEQWKKHIEEIKDSNSKDLTSGRIEEKMNLSNNRSLSVEQQGEELKKLRDENERLKSELKSVMGEELLMEHKKPATVIDDKFSNHATSDVKISAKEARLIALVGAFLNFHRFGEHIDAISKYVLKIDSSLAMEDIQSLLRKFPTVFKESLQEKKWSVLGL